MAESIPLGDQIANVLLARTHDERHPFNDVEPESAQPDNLAGVVGQQSDARQPEIREYLRTDPVVTQVRLKPQRDIGLYRIEPPVLQGIRPQLVLDADTSPLLPHVEHHAPALPGDHLHCQR